MKKLLFTIAYLGFAANLFADFSYMPAEVETRINDDSKFSSAERSTILGKSQADRVADVEAGDTLMRRFYKECTDYQMNQYALTRYNASGSTPEHLYLVDEGMVDNGTNEIIDTGSQGDYNQKAFKLFIGLAEGATLDGTQTTLYNDMRTTLEGIGGAESIANRKRWRCIRWVS